VLELPNHFGESIMILGQFDLPLNLLHDIRMLQTNNSIDKKISTLYWFGSTENQVFWI
jgi:hypothetical protein